jgi:hypothetical protein
MTSLGGRLIVTSDEYLIILGPSRCAHPIVAAQHRWRAG